MSKQSVCDDTEIIMSIVSVFSREEGQIEIAFVVVNGTATAISSRQIYAFLLGCVNVALEPGILMTTEHHARIVSIEEQHVVFGKVKAAIQPMLQRQIDEHVRGLRN